MILGTDSTSSLRSWYDLSKCSPSYVEKEAISPNGHFHKTHLRSLKKSRRESRHHVFFIGSEHCDFSFLLSRMPATPSNYTTSSSEFLKFLETCEEVLWQVVSLWTTTHLYSFRTLSLLKQWPGLPQMVSHAFLRMTLIGSLTSALTLLWATKTHTVNTKTQESWGQKYDWNNAFTAGRWDSALPLQTCLLQFFFPIRDPRVYTLAV